MDAISTTRLASLYPELARRWTLVNQYLQLTGVTVRISQGLRTWGAQALLYAQGRTIPGQIVTQARAGESWHNYGCALDFVPMGDDGPIWDRTHPWYAITIQEAELQGLTSGSRWPEPKTDFPHIQFLNERFPDSPDDEVRYIYSEGGITAVWAEIDKTLSDARMDR